MDLRLTAVYRQVPEGGYVAWLQEVPGACTQGDTLEEVRANLREAMQLVFERSREMDDARRAELPAIRERFRVTIDDGRS